MEGALRFMEVKETSKKRELIKTIAIIFLVVMLVLTFFSQTIMNYSLPEVATQMVTSGTINAKIRGSGAVSVNESYEVMLDQTREIRSVCVKVGDTVEQGDLLFVLGDTESQELKDAQEALDTQELDYQRKILELSKEYAADNQSMKQIREDLQKAIEERDKNAVSDEQISFAKGDLATANVQLKEIEAQITELNEALSGVSTEASTQDQADVDRLTKEVAGMAKTVEAAQKGVTEAEGEVSEAKSQVSTAEGTVETCRKALNDFTATGTLETERKIQDAENELQKAQEQWRTDWLAYRGTLRELFNEAGRRYAVEGSNFSAMEPQEISSTQQMYVEAYLKEKKSELSASSNSSGGDTGSGEAGDETSDLPTATTTTDVYPSSSDLSRWESAYETLIADQEDIATKEQALNRLQQDSSITADTSAEQRQKLEQDLNDAQAALTQAQIVLQTAQQKLSGAESTLKSAEGEQAAAQQRLDDATAYAKAQATALSTEQTNSLKAQIKACEAEKLEQEAEVTRLDEALKALEEKQTTYKAAVETVDTKQRELENALSGKDIDKEMDDLELESARLAIEKQKALVEEYRADTVDTEIKANVSGIVSAINVSAGKNSTPDTALAVIDVVDRGYTLKISVTSDQAKQVKLGDTADITNYYWGNDITATLDAITPDPDNPGKNKLLVFRITGDVDAGTNLTLSIGQRSAGFDAVIPKSALRTDTNGSFVLILTSRSTPLGNRYTATRVDVQVLAEDDTTAAVSGLSANTDYVITTSSKPLDAGTQVRMVENQ